jgi:hypothetical protein
MIGSIRCQLGIHGRAIITLSILAMIALCTVSRAQTSRSITIQMLDSKTGQPIVTSEFQAWTGESSITAHTGGISPRYVKPGSDGFGELMLPLGPSVITIHAQYGKAGWGYVNCDRLKDRGPFREHWYSISEIMSSGIAAPNYCSKRQAAAKPGQFIFFVREMTSWEKMHE